ncbi:MAG: GAF and ANTAR domain-containing protein [Rhodoglobus sp.]
MTDEDVALPYRSPVSPTGLCGLFVDSLPVTGASISVFDEAGRQSTICSSDSRATRLDELQLEMGIGPRWEVLRTGKQVVAPDLPHSNPSWSSFAAAAVDLGVGALFAFPMSVGAVTVGVVELHSTAAGMLNHGDISIAQRLTSGVTWRAVHLGLRSTREASIADSRAPALRREVHQATGMILVQLGVGATEAFARLRAYAFATGRPVQDVAHDVVTWKLDFSDLPD